MRGYSALTHTRHHTRRVPGVPGSAKRRFLTRPGKGKKTCIYSHNNTLLVYSSPDLSSGSWVLEDTVYQNPPGTPRAHWLLLRRLPSPAPRAAPRFACSQESGLRHRTLTSGVCIVPRRVLAVVGSPLPPLLPPAGRGAGHFPECTYFRSQAVYNPATKRYVLWARAPAPCSGLPRTPLSCLALC